MEKSLFLWKYQAGMKKIKLALHWQILIALILGVCFGIYFTENSSWVIWMGTLFLRALNMIIVPLILCSIISGVASVGNAENLGRIGLKTMGYYMATTLLAIVTGLLLVNLIKPGVGSELKFADTPEGITQSADSFGDTLLHIIPTNIFEAMSQGQMLSIIFFAILFGFFITKTEEKNQTFLLRFFDSSTDVIMKITLFVIRFTPLGVFGIVVKVVSEQIQMGNNLWDVFARMGWYMLSVILGLLIHGLFTLPLSVYLLGKANPIKHLRNMTTPLLTAFSTSSSNATLPLTMEAVEHKDGVSQKIAAFTLPLGATVNMNGTALYECVAVMFIAQAYGIELSFVQQIIVVFTALLAAVGSAGIPMAGLVMMTIVLKAVNLPLEGIGLILAVDRILDMFRTTINVYGDTCGAVIVAKSEGEKLKV